MAKDKNATNVVGLLVEVANADTVYRDLYLRRARQLLSATLDESAYRAIGSSEKEIEDLMRRSRSAVLQRDWDQAAELSARADGLRNGRRPWAISRQSERMCMTQRQWPLILFPRKAPGATSGS